jgi:hypothetical protein
MFNLIHRIDEKCYSRTRYIQVRPDHALDECNQRLHDFIKSRYYDPAHLVLGYETYHNLCIDLAQLASPKRLSQYEVGIVPRIREFKKIPICVDDTSCWEVRFLPSIEKMWPQYGKDDEVDKWEATNVGQADSPDSPPVRSD